MENNPSVKSVRILDDLFLRNRESIESAINLFGKYKDLSWRGMAHVLTFEKSLQLIPRLRESGCRELFIGVESGADQIRKKVCKAGTTEQVIAVISEILRIGINVKIYLMYGFPDETEKDAEETYMLAKTLKEISLQTKGKFRTSVFQFRPYHGTKIYDELIACGKKIHSVKSNTFLNTLQRRSQFNFHSGNFSKISDRSLNNYIIRTQLL
jgi:radical SAM superfamily enzyme YgiQ (UPF0313 family)